MFSKKQRLDSVTFNDVFKGGKRVFGENFILIYSINNLGLPRFGVSVSKKETKSVVKRHLLKRRFLHALKNSDYSGFSKDFVFILKSPLLELKYIDLVASLNKLKKQI